MTIPDGNATIVEASPRQPGFARHVVARNRLEAVAIEHHASALDDLRACARRLSIVDFCVAAPLPYAEKIHLPLAEYGDSRRWHGDLMALEAWRNPWPAPPEL